MTASTWVTGAVLIGAVLAFMLLRERWRLRALEGWAAERRFKVTSPFAPENQPIPAKTLSDVFSVNGALRWGAAAYGELEGVPVWVMECEASRPGMTSAWYTLVAWPISDAEASLVLAPPTWRLVPRLDQPEPQAPPQPPDPAGWQVSGSPDDRAAWLTPGRMAAMSQFPPPCVIGIRSGFASFRVEGVITPSRIEHVERTLSEIRSKLDL